MGEAGRVLPSLYIGSAPTSAEEFEALRQDSSVTALLSLQTDADLWGRGLSWDMEARWCEAQGIAAHRLPIEDWSPQAVIEHLDEAVELLSRLLAEEQVVYLHCTAGVNRSPSVALAYLVKVQHLSLAEALQIVRRARPAAQPYPEVLEALGP
ncbi:MAG: dual specificity protein phosphatase family protein [bacterium]